ncbi:MAG: IS630 family transposase, partial [Nevskia sp.]|nr:IS630 family transposase [Nevskia sp.]
LLRKADKRTVDALGNHIGSLLDSFSPDECANYFASSGYVAL